MRPKGRGPRIEIVGDPEARRKNDAQAIAMVSASMIGPLLLTYVLVATDMRTDLSELKPRQTTSENGDALVSWASLATDRRREGRVRMLGYMMDGYQPVRDGTPVNIFILTPEAGHLLQPARRIPGKMVEIRLADGQSLPFRNRSLVWVEGVLRRNGGDAYMMEEASAQPAKDSEVAHWFSP